MALIAQAVLIAAVVSELRMHEAALGYRLDEHVSIELYYDNTGEDKVGIRGMWHL